MFKTISAAALIAAMATASTAGSLAEPIIEIPAVVEGSSSSIGAPAVLGAVVAAAALAALVADDDDEGTINSSGTGD